MPGFLSKTDLKPNALTAARLKAEAEGRALIDLTESNPTKCGFIFPSAILQNAACRYISGRRYEPDPHGLPAARRAIQAYYASRMPPFEIPDDHIFITASTSEAYRLIFSLLCDSGDNLLVPNPCYPLFESLAADQHVELKSYKLQPEKNWEICPKSLLGARDSRTRGVLLISPHNPTGYTQYAPLSEITQAGLPLICDEVFAGFVDVDADAPPLGALYPHLPVFLLNGISKMFALPDLKIGWVALNNPAHRRFGVRLELLNDAYLSSSILSQAMLTDIFEHGAQFRRDMIFKIRENVRFATERLARSGLFEIDLPCGGTFVFPKIKPDVDEDLLVLECIANGVILHPGYFYGESVDSHVMISCVPKREMLEIGIELIIKTLTVLAD